MYFHILVSGQLGVRLRGEARQKIKSEVNPGNGIKAHNDLKAILSCDKKQFDQQQAPDKPKDGTSWKQSTSASDILKSRQPFRFLFRANVA